MFIKDILLLDLCNVEKLKQNEWKTAKATFGILFRLSANCFSVFGLGFGQEFSFRCIPRSDPVRYHSSRRTCVAR
jgi:hypothetical protein